MCLFRLGFSEFRGQWLGFMGLDAGGLRAQLYNFRGLRLEA